ncbi:uracil-DNA glycosylase-like protein [Schizothecium vesticola]|uniref:Uracil-DNA glycosylase-like protein n=1 Tax=Schizothecium vesticola TaxID=314040 RepID=A0AA40F5Q7_9PEZI|nr:uracil-DNA glycosylase-like protein [Schizothecium vesticola]
MSSPLSDPLTDFVEPPDGTPPPPTFAGRLALRDFVFTDRPAASEPPGPTRRSTRLSATPARRPGTVPVPVPTPSTSSAPASPVPRPTKRPLPPSLPPSPAKRARTSTPTSYTPPTTYAHLGASPLPDAVGPNLLVLFVGLNPGLQTARSRHAYAHPTNHFWRLLASSGLTPRLCAPTEDQQMPRLYGLGLTNIVARPSRNGAELSKGEMDAGVAVLEAKARRWRPEVVCIVGKSIWESVWRVRRGKGMKKGEFAYGWQGEGENMGVGEGDWEEGREGVVEGEGNGGREWKGARVFVATSTSGLAATLKPAEKEAIWKELGDWAVKRREERKAEAEAKAETAGTAD